MGMGEGYQTVKKKTFNGLGNDMPLQFCGDKATS